MNLEGKKALAYFKLVALIIGAIFLIVMILYISSQSETAQYEQSLIMCNQFFKSINGKPLYFNETLDVFTPSLSNSLRDLCPSRDVEVSSRNVKPALDLMKDCWFKTGSGNDIFPETSKDMKLCFYCGRIKSDGEIDGFKNKIEDELQEDKYISLLTTDSEIINLNSATFSAVPDTFSDDMEIALFYYIYKPPVETTGKLGEDLKLWAKDEINRGIRNFIGENLEIGPMLNYYVLDDLLIGELVKTSGGIVAISQQEVEEEDFEDIKNRISTRDCYVIYPLENYD